MTKNNSTLRAKHRKGKVLGAFFIAGYSIFLAILLVKLQPEFLQEIEDKTIDARIRLTANQDDADSRIKIIDIDQASLEFFEREYALSWPLPRDIYAEVLNFLSRTSVRGFAFDMLFTESSSHTVESDVIFGNATETTFPVVHAVSLHRYKKNIEAEQLNKFELIQRERDSKTSYSSRCLSQKTEKQFQSVTLPVPELLEHSSGLGSVHAEPDSDGVFRRYSAGGYVQSIPVLSLPFALLDLSVDANSFCKEKHTFDKPNLVRPHGGRNTYERISLAKVISAAAQPENSKEANRILKMFEDSWVFLGASAPGLFDLRPTSLEERGIGVQFVATVFDNALNDSFIRPSSELQSIGVTILLIILFSLVTLIGEDVKKHILGIAVVSLFFIGISIFIFDSGYAVSQVIPLSCGLLAAFLCLGLQYQLVGREHRFIQSAFQHYVSPALVKQIVQKPESLSLGGEKKEVSIFFSDIAGFTSISEKMDASSVATLLNDYLSLMTEIIQEHGGTVDKFVGDAVIAFWNAPLIDEVHGLNAVNAAINCQKMLKNEQERFLSFYGVHPKTRIGINTGLVNVGNFGSKSRFNYTIIGDEVNLASRLEGANKQFGTLILLSEQTKSCLNDSIDLRKVGQVQVLGKERPIWVFEPLFSPTQIFFSNKKRLSSFEQALNLFQSGKLNEAREVFLEFSSDPVSNSYIDRIQLELSKHDNSFNPVWKLSEK